jgi:hypothetical protein
MHIPRLLGIGERGKYGSKEENRDTWAWMKVARDIPASSSTRGCDFFKDSRPVSWLPLSCLKLAFPSFKTVAL